jgi:hypothetical protein
LWSCFWSGISCIDGTSRREYRKPSELLVDLGGY